jgi:RNA polymerase sigma-70 factor (ECF subfamily)
MSEDFSEFYLGCRHAVFRSVLAATGSRTDAEEATSEGFARAFTAWESVSQHPNPEAWVVMTAVNHHRSTWRKMKRLVPLDGTDRAAAAMPGGVEEALIEQVMQLPPRQREAISLCVLLEMDSESAGKVLGVAAATVRVHLHRGLQTLRDTIGKENSKR